MVCKINCSFKFKKKKTAQFLLYYKLNSNPVISALKYTNYKFILITFSSKKL